VGKYLGREKMSQKSKRKLCSGTKYPEDLFREIPAPNLFGTGKDFEIVFCRDILDRAPNNVGTRTLFRELCGHSGFLSKIKPIFGSVYYNLACSFALLGNPEKAIGNLEKAIDSGWSDYERIKSDTDLAPLRDDPRYWRLVAKLAKKK